jgi:hypothetical protein
MKGNGLLGSRSFVVRCEIDPFMVFRPSNQAISSRALGRRRLRFWTRGCVAAWVPDGRGFPPTDRNGLFLVGLERQ